MEPSLAHQLLLLFMRANVSKTGSLSADELSEISWMPMLGGVATELQTRLQAEGAGCCLGPKAWLELCAKHHATPAALGSFIGLCEMMTDTFPELEMPAADSSQLDALGEIAQQGGGERMINTLCIAAACGNASVAQFVLAEYTPQISADWGPLELLQGLVSSALSGAAQDEAPGAEQEAAAAAEDEDADEQELIEMMDVTVPDGAAGGDSMTLVLPEGDEMQVTIPAGLAAGDKFRVSIEKAEEVKPGEEDKLHAPEGGAVIRGADDDGDDGELLEQRPGNYTEVAALLSAAATTPATTTTAAAAAAAEPEPEPEPELEPELEPVAAASEAARQERASQLASQAADGGDR